MTDTQRELEKNLFEMVYQWGRVGVVTDHESFAFQDTMKEIIHQAEQEMLERQLEKVNERVKEYHKDCLTDMFINGHFWAYKDMQQDLLSLSPKSSEKTEEINPNK